jgi:ketosteroid isomerase-like protein
MSQDNREVVRRAVAAFNRDELAATGGWYHADVEFHEDPNFPDAAVHRGAEAIEAHFQEFLDSFDDYSFEIEEILDVGDSVVVVNRQRARGKGSGAEVDMRNTWVFDFRDGKIQRITPYWERAKALEAVGLSE